MGWTSYHAFYYKKGTVNRKAECDDFFSEGLNRNNYEVLRSAMRGSIYYAAVKCLKRYKKENNEYVCDKEGRRVKEDIPISEQKVYAVILLTHVNMKDYENFSYKVMDESEIPYAYDCPKGILDLLSETDNENALEWRKKCRDNIEAKRNKNTPGTLPIGTRIKFTLGSTTYELIKRPPMRQFKRPFWYNLKNNTYVPKTRIPNNFEII